MNINTQTALRWCVALAITAVVCALLWYFRSVVVYILISGVLAIIGRPLVRWISTIRIGRWSVPRSIAALLTLFAMWIVVISLCSIIVPLVIGEIQTLSSLDLRSALSNVQGPMERIQEYLRSVFLISDTSVSLSEVLMRMLRSVVDFDTINSAFSSLIDMGVSVVVVFFSVSFITFFFMKEDGLFFAIVTSLFPERYKESVERALDKVTHLLSRYFAGLMLESLILMVVISLVMMAFGMQGSKACFIAITMGVMNLVPYAGPLIGGVASVFIGIITPIEGSTIGWTVTIIVCTLLTIKAIDDFVIQPILYSDRVKAHPLEIFIVILIAGSVGGIWGMILAIPSYTVLRVFAKEFFSQYALVQKLTKEV